MKISREKIDVLCRKQGTSVSGLLGEAGVSRNTFYTLARKDSVVPQSLIHIAEHLGVPVSALLDDVLPHGQRMQHLIAESNRIAKRYRATERDNVRHTLLLLQEEPIERLRRALRRGRSAHLR